MVRVGKARGGWGWERVRPHGLDLKDPWGLARPRGTLSLSGLSLERLWGLSGVPSGPGLRGASARRWLPPGGDLGHADGKGVVSRETGGRAVFRQTLRTEGTVGFAYLS